MSKKNKRLHQNNPDKFIAALTTIPPIKLDLEFNTKKEIVKQIHLNGVIKNQLQKIEDLPISEKFLTYMERTFLMNIDLFKKVAKIVHKKPAQISVKIEVSDTTMNKKN